MNAGTCMVLGGLWAALGVSGATEPREGPEGGRQRLPRPVLSSETSVEQAIAARRSVRSFADLPLTDGEIGQLCWAAQGITDPQGGFRASPSAGALYPLELYVVTAERVGHYHPREHALSTRLSGDHRPAVRRAALDQSAIGEAPACLVITAVVDRSARKYGRRAERYCFIEAGHVAQNILLQATALGLGGVPIGAFDDQGVARVLKLPEGERVLYLLPVGHPGG